MQLSTKQWQRAQHIFELVIDSPKEEHDFLLNDYCQGDDGLRKAVLQLINNDQEIHTFVTDHVSQTLVQLIEDHELVADVGRYRLLKKLGEGGMGQIYLAERSDDEFQKQVVIKLIRNDQIMNEYSTVQFRKERQTLASLEHPNIAQLLDGGSLDNGTPYVVMTYVEGLPITTYCTSHNLTLTQRIGLFIKLCSALEYAHQKLIIHRDIKPANVLVNASGEPQLLDFGIAQSSEAAGRELDSQGLNSGTPGYASPEQLLGQPQFASSDVYSLGVLLYELIFDQRPHSGIDTPNLMVAMQKPINFAAAWQGVEDRGQRNTQRLLFLWKKELQAICEKALTFQQNQRYPSCQALVQDLRRLLNADPIDVYSLSKVYQLRKFIYRHRLPVVLGCGLLVSLSTFVASTVVQSKRLTIQRDQAISQQKKAQALSEILLNAYQDADPTHTRGEHVSAREILDESIRHIDNKLNQQDATRIELKSTLSAVYKNLGLYDKAKTIAQQAVEEAQNISGFDQHMLIEMKLNLAMILSQSGAGSKAVGMIIDPLLLEPVLLEHTGEGQEALRWKAMKLKARTLSRQTKGAEAIEVYRQILSEKKKKLTSDDGSLIESLYDLGHITYYDGYGEEGEALMLEAFHSLNKDRSYSHRLRSKVTQGMANFLIRENKMVEAQQLYEEFYEYTQKIYGPEHPAMGSVINKLAEIYYRQGRIQQSIVYFQRFIGLSEKFYGPVHINVAFAKFNLAIVLEENPDQVEKAAVLYQQAIDIGHHVYKTQHKNLGYFYRSLGQLYLKRDLPKLAKPYLEKSLTNYLYVNAPEGGDIAKGRLLMAQVYDQLRVKGVTKKYLDLALPVLEKNYSAENTYVQQAKALQQKISE